MKTNNYFFTLLILLISTIAFAQTPNSSYVIQTNDWLSKIAQTAYGNASLYSKIVEGTNQKAAKDNSYQRINDATAVQIGQKIWIPALADSDKGTSTATSTAKNMESVPVTNCEIRLWYNYQVVAIGKINERWEEEGIDLKTRAEKAYELRHNARMNARYMMQNKEQVKGLQKRDTEKYGNPNGPTFDYLVKKNTDNGKSLNEAYQSIIDSSSRTDTKYNEDCQ